jgi:hypothetical protein
MPLAHFSKQPFAPLTAEAAGCLRCPAMRDRAALAGRTGFSSCRSAVVRRRPPTRGASFEGYWQTRDGGMTEITQNGDLVELNGRDGSGMIGYQARGRIDNGQAVLRFANSAGLTRRVVLRLAQPGDFINGQMLDAGGGYIQGELQTIMGVCRST